MASINGLQNNALIVGTIDGLQTIYATQIYDNGVLLNPLGYVPYTGATGAVNLNGQDLTNVGKLSTNGVNTFSGVASGTPSTSSSYLALNATNQLIQTSIAPNIPVSAVNTGTWYPTFNATDTTGNVSTLYVDSTGALYYNPTTGTLSSTYFSGIASNATNATNAVNVDLVQWTSGGGLIYLVGSSGYTTGYYTLESQNTLTFNPATNTLTAGVFSGYATGGVFATTTSNINLIGTDRSVAGNGGLYTQNLLYYNPSTYVLYTQGLNVSGTTISTTPSWTLALDATNNVVRVAVGGNASTLTTTGTSTNTTYYPTFTTNYSTTPTALSYYTDSAAALTYNPSTHTLTTSQLTLSSIVSGTPTTYIALNSSGQVVSYTPTGTTANTLLTTGTNSSSTFYPVFTTAHSTTPTQLSYYTDSTSAPLSYVPSTETLTTSNMVANQLLCPAAVGNLTLGVSGSTSSYLSLSAGLGNFNGNVQVSGGTLQVGTTGISPYTTLTTSALNMYNGANTIQTSSQGLLHILGTSSAFSSDFIIQNPTAYGSMTGGVTIYANASNASLGELNFTTTNATVSGTAGMYVRLAAPSTTSGTAGTLTTYASFDSTGMSLQGGGGTLTITTFSYTITTSLVVFSFASATNYPRAGAYITVSGLTGTPAVLNTTYQIISSTATSITVQSYYGAALTYVSGGTITTISPATAGITLGDLTTISSHRAPLITMITTTSAVAGTPLTGGGNYNTPIGCKYLRVRMCGAGAGGSNQTTSPFASSGGYTTFGTYLAYGGQCAINQNTGASVFTTTYPYWYYAGGIGGGFFAPRTSAFTASSGTLNIDTTFANSIAINPTATKLYTMGFMPSSWNGTFTITSVFSTSVNFSASGLSAITQYGYFSFAPPDANTILINGSTGGGAGNEGTTAQGPEGGISVFGGYAPSGNVQINPYGYPANYPSPPVGQLSFGCGGRGDMALSGLFSGSGGGAGQYLETYISAPATSYSYSIGLGGLGASGDTGQRYGSSSGGNGLIIVEAYF